MKRKTKQIYKNTKYHLMLQNGFFMITTRPYNPLEQLTEKEKQELELLRGIDDDEIVFDEDCPPMSPVLEKAFQCAVSQRNRARKIAN